MGLRKVNYIKNRTVLSLIVLLFCYGCSHTSSYDSVARRKEYYKGVSRTTPQIPVYSRVTWSHLPEPLTASGGNKTPLMMKEFSFVLPNSDLGESLEAVSQTMGFRVKCPSELKNRRVSINRKDTIVGVLREIGEQCQVRMVVDVDQRLISVFPE